MSKKTKQLFATLVLLLLVLLQSLSLPRSGLSLSRSGYSASSDVSDSAYTRTVTAREDSRARYSR